MNKHVKSIAGVFAIGIAAMASCKNASPTGNITGSWKITNEQQEVKTTGGSEHRPVSAQPNGKLTFSADGTMAAAITGTPDEQSKWELVNDNKYLKLSGKWGESSLYVQKLTATQMELKDTSTGSPMVTRFAKL